ncbi:MAG: efflux RND transporter periplasmic adaptor subunit [Betaproteobacteria bacterium]|nr:efflux RND transporter periplasmic adaptor subunit [Betaproteobacteria bacterium]MDH5220538.1 efflux RND transporter periplasmic adaptor subunit [Betaproteobacteria bacterium]MDH5350811.1 efflux RND transporter periplasmic adaptor subunit [Betaproteobacteria bacterium]
MSPVKTGLAIAALAAAVAAYVWLTPANGGKEPQYRLAKVERGPLTAVVIASGTLNAVTTVQVGSQISGQIKEIHVDFNSPVKANQVIARIDPATFELRVNQARADLDAAQSAVAVAESALAAQQAERGRVRINLGDAERDYERKRALVDKNYISSAELDKARTLLEATREQLKAMQAQARVNEAQVKSALASVKQRQSLLRQAQVDLERTIIRAPVDGTVILRNVDAGQTVAASLQAPVLFTIARDLRDMQVEAAIDEADVGRLRAGQSASFTVDAFPRRNFTGEIVQIRKSPVTVQNVVSYTVVISARNPDLSLLPGMTANVRIVVDQRDSALKVPNAALRFRPAGATAADVKPAADATPAAAARGQALQQFRDRLFAEVTPDAAQQARLDAVFAEQRPKFAALRDLTDEAARRKQSERLRAELRAQVEGILRAEQKPAYERLLRELGARSTAAAGRVWIPAAGAPRAVELRLGLSDGTSTEVLGGELAEGAEVIVGLAPGSERNGSGLPRMRLF